jgi:C4-type Zn-finger protein
MARVKKDEPRFSDENGLIARTKKYAFLKSQLDYFEKEQKALRALLFETLDEIGEEDDKGNVIIELPEEVEGYSSVVKQRRVSRKIDEALAEELIIKHGLEDVLYKTIRVVDEDALMAALYEDVLTEEEVDEIYPQSITWALVLKK